MSSLRKLLWLLLFTVLGGLTIYDLVELTQVPHLSTTPPGHLTQEYLTNPVDVSTTIDHRDAVAFPSVTVCNQVESSATVHLSFLESGELPEAGGDDEEVQGDPGHPSPPGWGDAV